MNTDGGGADALVEWLPDATARQKILVDNPARLYDFASKALTPAS